MKKILSVLTATILTLSMMVSIVMSQGQTVEAKEVTDWEYEGRCGDHATYSYDEGSETLTISGTGEMWDGAVIPSGPNPIISRVVIEKGITVIGKNTFQYEGYEGSRIDRVEISDTVTTIKSGAFKDIGEVTIPKSVKTVESNAFGGKIYKVVIEGNMDHYAVGSLGGATVVVLKGNAESLGFALSEATMVSEDCPTVKISKSNNKCKKVDGFILSADGKKLYFDNTYDDKRKIPDTVETIKAGAYYCHYIDNLKLGKIVKRIEPYAFYETSLRKLRTNSKLKTIGRCAFSKTWLSKVTLNSSVSMSPIAFDSEVVLTSKKSFKKLRTVMTSATLKKNKIRAKFAKLTGAKGYQVQIKKGNRIYKYYTTKNSINIKAPKVLRNYNVKFSYSIDEYTSKIEGEPAYVSVRPYKTVKKNKKSYGKWSEKIVLTK